MCPPKVGMRLKLVIGTIEMKLNWNCRIFGVVLMWFARIYSNATRGITAGNRLYPTELIFFNSLRRFGGDNQNENNDIEIMQIRPSVTKKGGNIVQCCR